MDRRTDGRSGPTTRPAFAKATQVKNSTRNTIGVSNGLDPDQDQHFVSPDLGPNCLQKLSAGDKSFR